MNANMMKYYRLQLIIVDLQKILRLMRTSFRLLGDVEIISDGCYLSLIYEKAKIL